MLEKRSSTKREDKGSSAAKVDPAKEMLRAVLETALIASHSWLARLQLGTMCNIAHRVCTEHGGMCEEGATVCHIAASALNDPRVKDRMTKLADEKLLKH